jgi:hypothetical protein
MRIKAKRAQACADVENVEQAKHRFGEWRENRKHGEHIPEVLWAMAIDLAKAHGVERIACELRVDHDRLKKRLLGASGAMRMQGAEEGFIELFAPQAVGMGECVVELSNARGAKMRVQFQGGDMAGLAGLMNAFWSAP